MNVKISRQRHTEDKYCMSYRVSEHGHENGAPPMTKEQLRDIAEAINRFLGVE